MLYEKQNNESNHTECSAKAFFVGTGVHFLSWFACTKCRRSKCFRDMDEVLNGNPTSNQHVLTLQGGSEQARLYATEGIVRANPTQAVYDAESRPAIIYGLPAIIRK